MIILACAAGMSTSMLVTKMQNEAEAQGKNYDIFAISISEVDDKVASNHPDVLLLGPQVRYTLNELKKKFDIPVEVIAMQDYGMMNGKNVLNRAMELMGEA